MLLDASASEMPTRILGPAGPTFLALGDDGHLLAVAQSATDLVDLYSLKAARPVALATLRVASPAAQTFTVALSPDGRLLAASGTDGTVTLYDVSDPSHPAHLATLGGFTSTVYDVTFGPGGRTLAAASNDGSVRQWDLSQPARPVSYTHLDVYKRQLISPRVAVPLPQHGMVEGLRRFGRVAICGRVR